MRSIAFAFLCLATAPLRAQVPGAAESRSAADTRTAAVSFDDAAASVKAQLEQSLVDLDALRRRIADEKIPLSEELRGLEDELIRVRQEFQQKSRSLDARTLEL
ncbi:MAG TPA: hypothetical protein VEI02_11400, partial [Planctomycetota bacterium]|nr:hypothetical protein [Planctomycetota bacterium]